MADPRSDPREDSTAQLSEKGRGAGVPPAVFLPQGAELKVRGRRLPHWEVPGGTYFVTFRLADALPKQAVAKIEFQQKDIVASAAGADRELSAGERRKLRRLLSPRIEHTLDQGEGACFLGMPRIARIVSNALVQFDGDRYRLFAWCVMPNHVHVLFQPTGSSEIADVIHSWKSFSAKFANKILRRRGEFWQREYYDHLIRNTDEFERAERYILNNPRKAGLTDWQWAWSRTK